MSNNYKPTKWLGGKTIGTAQVMNNIEQGISNAHDRLDNVENGILSAHNRLNNVDSQIKDIEFQLDNNINDYNEVINNILVSYENVTITFKEGVHEIEKIVIDNKHNFRIRGKKGSILKLKDNSNNSLIWIKNSCSNVLVENINLDGNKEKQSHVSNNTTPFVNNTALLLIQSNNTVLNDIQVTNSRINALKCCAYTDNDEYLDGIILNNVKISDCYGGVECVFCNMPKLVNVRCKNIGGEFIEIIDVNSNTLTLSKNINHNHHNYLAIYDNDYNVICRVRKISQVNNSNMVKYSDINGTDSIDDTCKIFAINQLANGITLNNCDYAYISDCYIENTTLMGIGVINSTTQSIIENCKAINTSEESFCLDGTINSKVSCCYTKKSSTCSNAPAIHVANISPGIPDAYNNVIDGNIIEDCFYVGISAGLTNENYMLKRSIIKQNIIVNKLHINNLKGISASYATIEDNNITNFDIGIECSLSDNVTCIKNNNIYGVNNQGIGINIINSSHISILNNNILGFDVGVSNGVQGGNKVLNNYIDCNTGFDVKNKPALTCFVNNYTSHNEFKNGIPELCNTSSNKIVSGKFNRESTRSDFINTIKLPFSNGYILNVRSDGGYAYPSEKTYLCYFDKVLLISDKTEDKSIINTVVSKIDGNILISVEGNGGSKCLSYSYKALI